MDETRNLELLNSSAVLAEVFRELVVATGADRVRFLQGIITADVAGTPVGSGCHATLLTTKAHVVAEMWAFPRALDLYLAVPRGEAANTAQALSHYAIMDDFTAAPHPDFVFVAVLGPAAATRLAAAGYSSEEIAGRPLWSHADVSGPAGVLWLARVRQLGAAGFWVGGPAAAVRILTDALETLHVPRLAPEAAEAARVLAGEPAWGREITGEYFPMEVGLADAIDYGKGCFLGQEPIVRIRDRGHTNWRLVRLEQAIARGEAVGEHDAYVPVAGDRLETDTRPKAGRLTSIARLPDGRWVGLAMAHVSLTAGQQVRIHPEQEPARAKDGTSSALAIMLP